MPICPLQYRNTNQAPPPGLRLSLATSGICSCSSLNMRLEEEMEKTKRDRWLGLKNQHEWKEALQSLLCRSDRAVESALTKIWHLQTPLEQKSRMSLTVNNFGFDKIDSSLLVEYALKVDAGGHLTKDEILFVRSRILKYWKQLMVLSKANLMDQELAERKADEIAKTTATKTY